MFAIELNDSIRSFLQKIQSNEKRSNPRQEIDNIISRGCISMDALILYYNEFGSSTTSLKKLLSPLHFRFKTRHVPGSNYSPEFKRKLQILSLQQKENDYQELIKRSQLNGNVPGSTPGKDAFTPSQMAKEIREQITTVFNVLVSVVSVVFAVWYWSGSSTRFPLHYRVILCLFFGILILVAEVVVYNSYLRKINDAKLKERAKKEKKRVIKKIII